MSEDLVQEVGRLKALLRLIDDKLFWLQAQSSSQDESFKRVAHIRSYLTEFVNDPIPLKSSVVRTESDT